MLMWPTVANFSAASPSSSRMKALTFSEFGPYLLNIYTLDGFNRLPNGIYSSFI